MTLLITNGQKILLDMKENKQYQKVKKQLETGILFYIVLALMLLAIVKG